MLVSYCILNRVLYRTENANKKFFQSINPLSLDMLLCLSSSTVWNQLLLFTSSWGAGPPCSQGGIPFPRICAHSLPTVRYNTYSVFTCTGRKREPGVYLHYFQSLSHLKKKSFQEKSSFLGDPVSTARF